MATATCDSCADRFSHGWGRRTPRWCSRCRSRAYRSSERKRRYGLDLADYDVLVRAQNGLCAICHEPETVKNGETLRQLDVDHCHETGVIRGLLCSRCNRGLGTFLDSPDRLRSAAAYLERLETSCR